MTHIERAREWITERWLHPDRIPELAALFAEVEREARASLQVPGVRLVQISEAFVEDMGARTVDGKAVLSYRFGEPDQRGISMLVVTRTEDGFVEHIATEARAQERARCAAEIRRCPHDGAAWDSQRAELDAKRLERLT